MPQTIYIFTGQYLIWRYYFLVGDQICPTCRHFGGLILQFYGIGCGVLWLDSRHDWLILVVVDSGCAWLRLVGVIASVGLWMWLRLWLHSKSWLFNRFPRCSWLRGKDYLRRFQRRRPRRRRCPRRCRRRRLRWCRRRLRSRRRRRLRCRLRCRRWRRRWRLRRHRLGISVGVVLYKL